MTLQIQISNKNISKLFSQSLLEALYMYSPPQIKSVPFIVFQPTKGYRIQPAASQFLNSLPQDDQYSVVTIVGKSKTGKSFLLNNLIGDRQMFPVSNHVGNCSQGIMMATQILNVNGIKTLVLDCQGFGSLEGSDDRDCKLFILALLLSSVILYNSMGTIDEQTLNNFSMIIEVGKMFEKQLQTEKSMPALFWVLRDFSLKMEDKNGSPITPKQYLESALDQQKGNTQIICHKNRIRRVIKSLFSDRVCETLVLPTQQLPSQMSSRPGNLRDQFIDDFRRFKSKLSNLIQKKGCKQFNGTKMTISSFVNALEVYVKSLNKSILEGTMPRIENITFQLRESQAKGCRSKLNVFLNEKKRDIMQEISEMLKSSSKIEDIDEIKNKYLQPVQKFYETTRNNIYQLTGQFQLDELESLKANFYEALQKQCSQMVKKCQQNSDQDQQIENICQYLTHISDEQQLDYSYATQIKQLKQKFIWKDKMAFANILLRVEVVYLRRKVQLSKQINLGYEKMYLELQFTKKQLHRLQQRNREIQSELITQIRQSRKTFATPAKQQTKSGIKSLAKQPGLIRNVNDSISKQQSNERNVNSSSKVESSSFYVPYVLIQKPEYLIAKIVRTLIKQDSKRNNYIEYVIDVNLLGQKWNVNRKFKDFSQLHSILVMMFQHVSLPDCRAITGPLSAADFNANKKQLVQQRRRQLQTYIHDLIAIQSVRNSRIMQKFIKINKEYTVL